MSRKASKVGPFILGETVGRGATGVVRLAFHKDTGQEVAVKIIEKGALFQKPDMAAKLEREIAVMKLLRHPNVLTMFDVYENSEKLFLVLEYARSGELFDYLLTNGPLESQAALQIFQQIIEGLYYCHTRGVCHRDLKPENLLLDENNCIKIADFGMAAVSHPPKLFETSCGSPHYASPEVVCGKPYDGLKADVWSCGVILYAIVAGKLPFDDDNIRNLLAKVKCGEFTIPSFVKADIQDLIRRMLIVDPEERYSLSDVREHPWYQTLTPENPCDGVFEDTFEPIEEIDEEIVRSLVALSFEDRNTPAIVRSLKSDEPNLTKTFYNDLLKRKMNPNPIAQKNGKSIGRTTSEGHMKKSKLKPADDGSPTKTEEAPKRTLLRRMSIGANGFLKIPLFSLGNSSSSSSSSSSAEPTSPSSSTAPLTPHSPASSPSSSSSEPEEKHRKVPKIKLNSSLDEGKGKTVGTTPRRSWLPSIFGDNKIKVKDLKDGVHSSKRTQEITKELEESLDVMGAKFSFNSRSDEIKVSITRDAKPIKFDIAIVQTGENERGKPVYFISFTRKKGDKDAFREIYQRLVSMLNI